jgi:hypothetical protein
VILAFIIPKMTNNFSINIDDIDFSKNFINNLIVNNTFSTDIIITKYNLILLFKLAIFIKKYFREAKLNITIKDVKYLNEDIFNKIKETNVIDKINLDLTDYKSKNIKSFITYLVNYKSIKLDIIFNLSKENAIIIYILISNYLNFKNDSDINIKFIVLNHNEIREIYYIFDLIKNKFDVFKNLNYSINNVPYCIFIDSIDKLSNNSYEDKEKVSTNCSNCKLLSKCK